MKVHEMKYTNTNTYLIEGDTGNLLFDTGWAAALMRPSKSTKDMELKSLKKKYKSKGFAAGCSREVIERGANQLGWELDKLLEMTLKAMADNEDLINEEMKAVA